MHGQSTWRMFCGHHTILLFSAFGRLASVVIVCDLGGARACHVVTVAVSLCATHCKARNSSNGVLAG